MRAVPLALGVTVTSLLAATGGAVPRDLDPTQRRVIAVGDVHADADHLRTVLRNTGLIDDADRWRGGPSILVQVGDFLDRGPDAREVMDLLMRLQGEAEAAGGQLLVLLGNHEAMNLLGIHRDVNPAAYAAFATPDSERRRRETWERVRAFHHRRRLDLGQSVQREGPDSEEEWLAAFPPGRLEYLDALGPKGTYGRWLRGLPAMARVGRSLFMHGGLGPQHLDLDVRAINRRIAEEIEAYDRFRAAMIGDGLALETASVQGLVFQALNELELIQRTAQRRGRVTSAEQARAMRLKWVLGCSEWFLLAADGPLWYRGMAAWTEEEHGQLVETLLQGFDADRFVLGHTEHYDGTIHVRFAGRIALVDSGLPAALEIGADQRLEAVYPEGRVVLAGPGAAPAPREDTRTVSGPGPDSP